VTPTHSRNHFCSLTHTLTFTPHTHTFVHGPDMTHSSLLLLLLLTFAATAATATRTTAKDRLRHHDHHRSSPLTVMFIPLDERFTTRDAWLNLAEITPHRVLTPPVDLLSHMKEQANITLLHDWVDDNIDACDVLVCSSELYLYGGLISSRQSNDTQEEVLARVARLAALKTRNPRSVEELCTQKIKNYKRFLLPNVFFSLRYLFTPSLPPSLPHTPLLPHSVCKFSFVFVVFSFFFPHHLFSRSVLLFSVLFFN
jgi:hypothetical protein